jgi:hypothetical protein
LTLAFFYTKLAARFPKQHASRFMLISMEILKMYLNIKYCEVNRENNLHIANSSCNPHQSTKRGQNKQN